MGQNFRWVVCLITAARRWRSDFGKRTPHRINLLSPWENEDKSTKLSELPVSVFLLMTCCLYVLAIVFRLHRYMDCLWTLYMDCLWNGVGSVCMRSNCSQIVTNYDRQGRGGRGHGQKKLSNR